MDWKKAGSGIETLSALVCCLVALERGAVLESDGRLVANRQGLFAGASDSRAMLESLGGGTIRCT